MLPVLKQTYLSFLSIRRMLKGKVSFPADPIISLLNVNQSLSLHKPFVKFVEKMAFFSCYYHRIHNSSITRSLTYTPFLCLDTSERWLLMG